MNQEKLPLVKIGILGGTGLYEMEGLEVKEKIDLRTPFGSPSSSVVIGVLEGKKVAFLSRHGPGHRLQPSEINYRANIYAFKMIGVERVISVNSVGSLKESIEPRDMVFSDQYFDRTHRLNTFFGDGIVAHISFAHPVCSELSKVLYEGARDLGLKAHLGGTYICIEGPAFSTVAESNLYRSWGFDVIGMTSVSEAKLCREAEICYATMNLVTDYDVWHEKEESVSVEMIIENLRQNIHNAKAVIKKAVVSLSDERSGKCECVEALKNCIVTQPDHISSDAKKRLRFIIQKYVEI
ncbi:S-methyl-5'-thioadenosine phosphorylase [bacterium]|nr:S-methyl-5'-thioadenosine phosphorylase [bacterium]